MLKIVQLTLLPSLKRLAQKQQTTKYMRPPYDNIKAVPTFVGRYRHLQMDHQTIYTYISC